jgi:hypothetical protein
MGREVCDPTLVEVEENSFERWTIHTRTLPATRDRPVPVPSTRPSISVEARANVRLEQPGVRRLPYEATITGDSIEVRWPIRWYETYGGRVDSGGR